MFGPDIDGRADEQEGSNLKEGWVELHRMDG